MPQEMAAEGDGADERAPPAAEAAAAGRTWWSFLKREPLVHFVVLGALLFGASALWQRRAREVVVIDRATIEALVRQQTEILGHPPSQQERALLVQGIVDDAVLLREAYRRGLEQDPVVEQHLVQKMRLLLGEEIPEPDEAALRALLAAEAERYRSPPTVSLDQVFYGDPAALPADLLERLRAGEDFRGLGERLFMLSHRLARYSVADLVGLFGEDLARQIFALPVGEWQGPFRSPEGVHLIRVAEKLPPRVPAFEEIEGWLREDWRHAMQQQMISAQLAALRERYRIVVEEGEAAR
jgi:PPIC-type PPIASE domain